MPGPKSATTIKVKVGRHCGELDSVVRLQPAQDLKGETFDIFTGSLTISGGFEHDHDMP